MKTDVSVRIGHTILKNPFLAASGTYGFGREYCEYISLSCWGGIAVKGLTLQPRAGNPPPRIIETPSGMLNAIGLQNPGIDVFIEQEIPFLRTFDTIIVANVAGNTENEYAKMGERLQNADVDVIELNLSCPNVKKGCLAFGSTPEGIELVVKSVRAVTDIPIWAKLTPNVTDVVSLARAAESAGADAISLINTLLGMSVNVDTKRPMLANNTGGLSGPAIRPVAVRMVYEVSRALDIPIIGMGGITSARDAIEFFLAGADAVMVGTWNFVDPQCISSMIRDYTEYLEQNGYSCHEDLVGGLIPY